MVACIGLSCTPSQQPTRQGARGEIEIASALPLAGLFGAEGRAAEEGARYAVERQAAVGGYRLTFVSYDDSLSGLPEPARGVQNIRRMIADPRVLGMVGPYTSFVAQPEIPVANAADLAMVSPSTTVDCLTQDMPFCRAPPRPSGEINFFRLPAPNRTAGAAMAGFAVRSLGLSRIAVLSDGYDDYSDPIADSFSSEFAALGGAVVDRESFALFTNDFTGILHRAVQAGAQAVYVSGSAGYGGCRVRAQMKGIFPAGAYFLGPDGLVDPSCVRDAGKEADQRMIATIQPAGPRTDDPAARSVVNSFRSAHPGSVGLYTFAAMDCADILIKAIRRTIEADGGRMPSRQQVLQAVAATANFHGLTGTWSFTPTGEATAPRLSLYRVQQGRWTLWRSITASGTPG